MKANTVLKFVCLLFFLIANKSFSQLQRRYVTYNVENGLAQNSVWDMHQDFRGYLWFGTADGINRFDGYEMHHYKKNPKNPNSIYGQSFFQFYETIDKELWTAHDRGLSVYDRNKDNFVNVIKSKHNFQILGCDQKNRLWLFEERFKIHVLDIKTRKIVKTIYKDYLNEYAYHTTSNSIQLGNYLICALNGSGLIKINLLKEEVELVDLSYLKPDIYRFNINSDSTFVTFSSVLKSILEFKLKGNELTFKIKPVSNYEPFKRTTGLYEWDNKYYAASLEGLFIINKKNLNTEEYIRSFNSNNSSFNYIQHLDVDNSNNLYISTNGMGVKMYSKYLNKFKHYRTPFEELNMVKSIVKTNDGKIITGVYNNGIVIYYPNNTYKQFIFTPAHSNNNSFKSVLGLINYSDDEILMLFSDRIMIFNHKTNKEKYIPNLTFKEFQFYPSFVKHEQEIYFQYNDSLKNTFLIIGPDFKAKKLFTIYDKNVTCFTFFKNKMLIGSNRGLLIKSINSTKINSTKIDVMVKHITVTKKNRIFVATVNGLYEINSNGDILKSYHVSNGLPDDFFYTALEDNSGKIWLSHNKGISELNLETNRFRNFDVKDGLQSNEFNTGAFYKDEQGQLFFGGVNGINIINPKEINLNTQPPKISINQILLNDELYKSDTSFNEIRALNFDYYNNTVSFDFSALEFTNPSMNTYKYMLKGYDKQWISSGTKHFARYAKIPSGNYDFIIYAANSDGVWNTEPKIIRIQIKEPYWQTTWFYLLIGVLFVSIVTGTTYLIIYRQKSKLRQQIKLQQELEQERLRIARDLHDNVGAHLSYLISNLDWMISHPEKLSPEEEKNKLANLTETGRQAILTLRQTIWAINNQALFLIDFADKFKTFAIKMLEFSDHIKLNFEEKIKYNDKLSPGITLHLFRICQEALNNILKHAKASQINILFESNDEFIFKFSIEDDGLGFDTREDYSKDHFGLVIMKERAEECEAVLNIYSEIGKGTKIELFIYRINR